MRQVYRYGIATFVASSLTLLGCGAESDGETDELELASSSQALQTEYVQSGYAREVKGSEILGAAATVIVPLRHSSGAVQTTSTGIPLQASCGATIIAPSYVVTAAHCVDNVSVSNPAAHRVTLQTYSFPDGHDYRKESAVSGTYPNLTHGRDPDYLRYTERFSCRVVMRCSADYGNLNCTGQDLADTALLRCDGEPGVKYGYIPVAASDEKVAEPHMFWAHELYNTVNSEDFRSHYKKYPRSSYQENFHYWGPAFPASGNAGRDFNQAYPLRSTEFRGDIARRHWKLDPNGTYPTNYYGAEVQWTDMAGCHGTSGSGVLQWNTTRAGWELLGPIAHGPTYAEDGVTLDLCTHPSMVGQGKHRMAYSLLKYTQHVAKWADDCRWTSDFSAPAFFPICPLNVSSYEATAGWCTGSTQELHTGDFNGDGRTDLLCTDFTTGYKWYGITNTSGQFVGTSYENDMRWCYGGRLVTGDFNADGRTDLLCQNKDSGYSWISYATRDGRHVNTGWEGTATYCAGSHLKVFAADVNGDRRADLLCHDPNSGLNTVALASSTGALNRGSAAQMYGSGWCYGAQGDFHVGDFNGDGRADMLCSNNQSGYKWLAYARPEGYFPRTDWEANMYWCGGSGVYLLTGDFNGDGRTDMLCNRWEDGYRWYALANAQGQFTGTTKEKAGGWCGGFYTRLHAITFEDRYTDFMCTDLWSGRKWIAYDPYF